MVGKDTDVVVHLLDMFLAEGQAVDILPGRAGRAVEAVEVADNTAAVVVASCQRRP